MEVSIPGTESVKSQPRDSNRILYPWIVVLPAFFLLPVYFILTGVHFPWILASLLAFFCFDNLGVQIGVHKLLCHRSFQTSVGIRRTLAVLSVFSGQGSPLVWVAVHTGNHHPHADSAKDLHSPIHGWFYAFIAWYWRCDTSLINFRYCREYLRDKGLVFVHRYHAWILLAYWVALLTAGIRPFIYLGLMPAAMSVTLAGFVNAGMHSRGGLLGKLFMKYQNYEGDSTFNSVWLGALTMGLGLHNNHHQSPSRLYYDLKWYEVDFSRWIIPLIKVRD
jgi:fatty-acid desaturase